MIFFELFYIRYFGPAIFCIKFVDGRIIESRTCEEAVIRREHETGSASSELPGHSRVNVDSIDTPAYRA